MIIWIGILFCILADIAWVISAIIAHFSIENRYKVTIESPISGAPTVEEIVDGVWDEETLYHTGAGSFGSAITKSISLSSGFNNIAMFTLYKKCK